MRIMGQFSIFFISPSLTQNFLYVSFNQQTLHACWDENRATNNDLLEMCKSLWMNGSTIIFVLQLFLQDFFEEK